MLDQLQKRDSYSIFAQPVSAEEVTSVNFINCLSQRTFYESLRDLYFVEMRFVSTLIKAVTLHWYCCCWIRYQVPDYHNVIKHPMDFATMRRKVDLQAYRTVDDIAADFRLMISNCMTYNAKTTVFYRAGVKLMNQV